MGDAADVASRSTLGSCPQASPGGGFDHCSFILCQSRQVSFIRGHKMNSLSSFLWGTGNRKIVIFFLILSEHRTEKDGVANATVIYILHC